MVLVVVWVLLGVVLEQVEAMAKPLLLPVPKKPPPGALKPPPGLPKPTKTKQKLNCLPRFLLLRNSSTSARPTGKDAQLVNLGTPLQGAYTKQGAIYVYIYTYILT